MSYSTATSRVSPDSEETINVTRIETARNGINIQATADGKVSLEFNNINFEMDKSQWIRIIHIIEQVNKFIHENNKELA